MKVRTFKDDKTKKVGIILIPEFCAEEERLIVDLFNKETELLIGNDNLQKGMALVRKESDFHQISAIENSKGKRFHLNPFQKQHED
jgi:hypothetical protein